MMSSVLRPVKDYVRRKLGERGFYDIKGLGFEIRTIEQFRSNAFAIMDRRQLQTRETVAELERKYQEPIVGEVKVHRLLELLAQIIDPSNFYLYCTSQLTHTLQVLEAMEEHGITDPDIIRATLIHDLGKLAFLKGELPENVEGGGKVPLGENEPGSGFANCHFTWDHADIVHARFKPYVNENIAWLLKWHSIQEECHPLMDDYDRKMFEKYYMPFVVHDRTFIFYHLPKKRLSDYLEVLEKAFPKPILFAGVIGLKIAHWITSLTGELAMPLAMVA